MSVEAEVLAELRRLRTRVPHLTGTLAASTDGLVLAQDAPGVEPDGLAALTAAALGVAHRMADATLRGEFRELVVRGAHGYLATYAAGPTAVLTLLAGDRTNVGRLHLEGRRSGTRIAGLVEAGPADEASAPVRPRASAGGRATGGTGERGRSGRALGALPVRGTSRTRQRGRQENGRPDGEGQGRSAGQA